MIEYTRFLKEGGSFMDLLEKFNDEFTIKAFANFAFEFQECFSDILSTEELIQRIKKNVKNITKSFKTPLYFFKFTICNAT